MLVQQHNASWWKDILFLLLILGGLFFILLGVRPLFVPDEGRYAEIGREMVASGNYITPYLNHIKYFEKPILFYWLESSAIKLGGLNLWSLRSINALIGLLGCLATYFTARKLYNRQTGLLAALILGTSLLYFVMVHMISLDLSVTVWIALCLYACLLGTEQKLSWTRRLYFWGASIFAAFAVLTKGLIGLVFPGMIIFAWIMIMGEWRILSRMYLPSCIVLFLIIAAPWHILVQQQNPEFFYFYFIEQHFLRYATKEIGHLQPVWFFIPYLMIGFFPWIIFLPQAIAKQFPLSWKNRQEYRSELFFLLWFFFIFIFFSLSKSKLIPYILPVFPPLAILTARYLQQRIAIHHYQKIKMMIALTWVFLLIALAAIPLIETRTIAPLAIKLKSLLTPQDEIITYNQYYQDLPFYLERKVSILNWRNELSYGMQHQDRHEWMIDDARFWELWHSPQRIFVMMNIYEYKNFQEIYPGEKTFLFGKTTQNVLMSNKPI